jgi:voltage-gated potassium channel
MAEEDGMMFQILQYFTKVLIKNPPVPLRLFALLLAVLCYGTTGFLYFELSNNPELTWLDGLWYTVVTMTTVGYGDFFPKTTGGRFLVGWPIMIFGIGILGYALSVVAAALINSKTKEIRGMSSFALKKHLIIFNYPGLAKLEHLLKELYLDPIFGNHVPIVLVDEFLEELPPELVKRNIHYVRGNPVRDETLMKAAIDEARFAIVLSRNEGNTASDNLNVSVTLAIEGRNGKVLTVVEIVDPASEELLHKAGCDKVVCTSRFGAHFLSQELLNPGIQEVIEDLLSAGRGQNMYLVEITQPLGFREAAELCGAQKHIALGIRTAKEVLLNPEGSVQLQSGDRLITVGPSRIDSI